MAIAIANSAAARRVGKLLSKDIPSYRQAYSDRTAWLMACLAELAYLRFNPPFSNSQRRWFRGNMAKLAEDGLLDGGKSAALIKLVDALGYDPEQEKARLKKELDVVGLRLEATFDNGGTQAILVANDKFIALAFRGTEAASMKDLKTDARAKTTACETGGKIHSGFSRAFEEVAAPIQETIDAEQHQKKPLFIAGHSLGGALATIAAKRLSHRGGIAACYTYGSPRVGDDGWISAIKTPIYRLVNAADCVTMLPPGNDVVTLLAWGLRVLSKCRIPLLSPAAGWLGARLVTNFGGYLHAGNMRYLTNCPSGSYAGVKLLYSVSFLYRMKGYLFRKLPWKKLLADHSIGIYRKKLMVVAEQRNEVVHIMVPVRSK